MDLSHNHQNRVQFNTVVVQQEKMKLVGFEPTTSANLKQLLQLTVMNEYNYVLHLR